MSSASNTSPKAVWPKSLKDAPGIRLPRDSTMEKQVWADKNLSVAELQECFRAAHDQLMIARREHIHELKAKVDKLEKREVEDKQKRDDALARTEGLAQDAARFKSYICTRVLARWTLEEITAEMTASNAKDDDHFID